MKKYLLAIFFSVGFLIFGILTISDYGINWDAPLHMLRGQAYVHYFLTGKTTYGYPKRTSPLFFNPGEYVTKYYQLAAEEPLNYRLAHPSAGLLPQVELKNVEKKIGRRISFYEDDSWNGKYFIDNDNPHPPLVDILAAFSNNLFYKNLNILGDIESYQLVYLLISSIGIFIVSMFAFDITGSLVAEVVAGLTLAIFPLFINASHVNMKDPEQAVFFIGAVYGIWHFVKDNQVRWFFLFVFFSALAVAVKWNIMFLPFIIVPWLFSIRKTPQFIGWFKKKKLVGLTVLGIVLVFGFLVTIWPWMWKSPLDKIIDIFRFYKNVGFDNNPFQPKGYIWHGFNFYPFILLMSRTPIIFLTLSLTAFIGGYFFPRRDKLKTEFLLALLIFIPVLHFSIPGTFFYGGVREFMEVVPAIAILSGIGAYLILKIGHQHTKMVLKIIITVLFIYQIIVTVKYNPNESAYFNILTGRLPGAVKKGIVDWTLTYGSIYKQGVVWLNNHAEKNAKIAVINGPQFAIAPIWLRSDISVSPGNYSGFDRKGEYLMDLYNPFNPTVFSSLYQKRFLRPVHTIDVDGIPLLMIYKNDPAYLNPGYEKEITSTNFIKELTTFQGKQTWMITLPKDEFITRITLKNVPTYCLNKHYSSLGFLSSDEISQQKNNEDIYTLNEKINLGYGKIQYQFPAEKAKNILIFITNIFSCFATGNIESISYLEQ